ncbi:MAG: metallophosphoesterase family protein [Thermoguttaceae bacterium]
MSNRPVRFIHAADFHLEQPPSGVAAVPGHLRELFLESAWLAAERVFEAVLSEEVEFLVLSGDLLDPLKTGPRGPLFLVEQFQRLAERGIPVYWAAGRVDAPELWPATIPLPENVCLFPGGQPAVFNYQRDGVPLVRVVGASRAGGRKVRAGEFEPDPAGLYTIGVIHGNAKAEPLRARKIDYWALGGSHTRNTLFSSPGIAHYPGTIQGRRPDQCGAHGCTLVQVDENRKTRTTLIPCDALRWQSEQVVVDPGTTREEMEPRLRDRVQKLKEAACGLDLLISWTAVGSGPLLGRLRRGNLASELLDGLQREFGTESPAAWSVSFQAESMAVLPAEWYEQDTIRGHFLRELREQQTSSAPILLDECLPEGHRGGRAEKEEARGEQPETREARKDRAGREEARERPAEKADVLAGLAELPDGALRDMVFRKAAMLGTDLLSGEESWT